MELLPKQQAIKVITTGIGSLPFDSIDQAIDYAFDFDLPYLPQLPKLTPDEAMLTQSLSGIDSGMERLGSEFCCWDAALKRLHNTEAKQFKMQFCGCYCLKHYALPKLADLQLVEALAKRLIAYIEFFKQRQIHLIIVLDEPQVTDHESFDHLYTHFFSQMPSSLHEHIGIHCCGTMPWEVVLDFPFKLVSIDLSLQQLNLREPTIRQLLINNQVEIIFGAIPTDWESANNSQLESLAEEIKSLALNPHRIIISPACGHGLRSLQMAEMGKKATHQLAKLLATSN